MERRSYATHITRHAGVKAASRNRPRWPVAAVLIPCLARGGHRPTTGANSTSKVPGCRPWFTSFQGRLGTCVREYRHTRTATANIPRVLRVARPFPLAPRTCFSWTGIGIVNHDIMNNLSQLHCVFDILSDALSGGLCTCTIRRRGTSHVAYMAPPGT